MYMYMYIYVYIYIHIHIHTYIYKTIQCAILLITTMTLWRHAGYGQPVEEFTHF